MKFCQLWCCFAVDLEEQGLTQEVLAAGPQQCSGQHWEHCWLWGYGERESGPADKPVVGKWFPVLVALAPPIFCGVSGGGTRWALMTLPTQTIPCFSGAQGHRHPVLAEQPGRPLLIALEQRVPCWSFPALQPSSALLAERPQPRRARSASSAAALPPRLLGRSLLMSSHTCWHKHIL